MLKIILQDRLTILSRIHNFTPKNRTKQAYATGLVLKMLKLNMSMENIQAVTNFTKEEIEDISKKNIRPVA